jgi:hypothetical protein
MTFTQVKPKESGGAQHRSASRNPKSLSRTLASPIPASA